MQLVKSTQPGSKEQRQDGKKGEQQSKAANSPLHSHGLGYESRREGAKAGQAAFHHIEAHHTPTVIVRSILLEQGIPQGHSPRLPQSNEDNDD